MARITEITLESELDEWLVENYRRYWPDAIFLDKFQIITEKGKAGVPDGFIIDPKNGQWFVVENELLKHGVWRHISKQLIQFVVALKNPFSVRKIRDRIFKEIMEDDEKKLWALEAFESTEIELLQKIESFFEIFPASLLILIDKIDTDLKDAVGALNINSEIYTLMKVNVGGATALVSPDLQEGKPGFVTEPEDRTPSKARSISSTIESMGLKKAGNKGNFSYYKTPEGDIVHLKYSKFHERQGYYWYGITRISLMFAEEFGINKFCFIMGDEGFVTVGMDVVNQYIKDAKTSREVSGDVRHYHTFIRMNPEPELLHYGGGESIPASDFYTSF